MSLPTHTPPRSAYDRYRPWRRVVEVGFFVAVTLFNAFANSITTLMDVRRAGLDHIAGWEPAVWEWTSGAVWLALVPVLVWMTRRWPTHWDNLHRRLPLHLAASVAVSVVHVVAMVVLREVLYAAQGADYDAGAWPARLAYEYLKDVRSYALIVGSVEAYRWFLRRLQGEARLLDAPEEGPAIEPVDRPERFLVRKLGREFLVAAEDIEWAQAAGNYVNLRVRQHDYPLRSTIAGLQARLDPARFARIHRSYLVNLDRVASIEPLDTGDARVHLHDGTTLPCSRRHRGELRGRATRAA